MKLDGKQILLTGADGFIGSHLVETLLKEGVRVKAFVYYNSFSSWGWLDSFPKDILSEVEIFQGDVRDPNGIRTAMKGIDIVFHLAALIGIPYSYHSPDNYVDTNIKGTLNVLQAARDFNVGRVLVTSTSEVYGTAIYVPIDEKHPRQGQSPYSATKIGADFMADSFFRSFKTPVTIVRPFNTYGPRQSARAVIPTIITQLLSGKKEIKLGSLEPTRDLVFVKDTAKGFVEIAKNETTIGEEVNIATQSEISIGDLALKLIQMIQPDAKIVSDDLRIRPEKSEVERLYGSNEKLESLVGWKPNTSLDQGLKETVEWFRDPKNLSKYKSEIYNI
ncbi:SDR family NAD(P)-dependent oxidoreductase [Leptospira kmetyi]|uniref:SDR family NAD(P)-dependent oxidoreductase n=1 Tax=Leptospira kmetyi TaxID=408139 RepID=A0A5F1XY66_9LEPT|nr:NAD-dependent 4,6-dehydratase LegB [Leptospira kmetyi]AYV57198.1 SDR family NAD(P)-dependent oxidoreductase [Leptospira kmetyi]TGK21437.1 SDR family NAD(P)-dependent oxidoreductase [Leptospira kmetyi]TGK28364.1 SDR family NAD(P)-dependent oxidoreductase [Leptospira kmetyi]TGL68268.1 SDR family NAD(P)-dependent oxidoreductase [Leptospira kmetyi]